MKYVVDTHALIWFLEGNPKIEAEAKAVLSNSTSELILPAIILAEATWIVELGRTSIPSVAHLFNAIKTDLRVTIYQFDRSVIDQSSTLSTIIEMHRSTNCFNYFDAFIPG
ncbi:MAG: PIN domain-containing protein [Thermosynechococcaceae cyanobacterium]